MTSRRAATTPAEPGAPMRQIAAAFLPGIVIAAGVYGLDWLGGETHDYMTIFWFTTTGYWLGRTYPTAPMRLGEAGE